VGSKDCEHLIVWDGARLRAQGTRKNELLKRLRPGLELFHNNGLNIRIIEELLK
jgi:hypothetical protein